MSMLWTRYSFETAGRRKQPKSKVKKNMSAKVFDDTGMMIARDHALRSGFASHGGHIWTFQGDCEILSFFHR